MATQSVPTAASLDADLLMLHPYLNRRQRIRTVVSLQLQLTRDMGHMRDSSAMSVLLGCNP